MVFSISSMLLATADLKSRSSISLKVFFHSRSRSAFPTIFSVTFSTSETGVTSTDLISVTISDLVSSRYFVRYGRSASLRLRISAALSATNARYSAADIACKSFPVFPATDTGACSTTSTYFPTWNDLALSASRILVHLTPLGDIKSIATYSLVISFPRPPDAVTPAHSLSPILMASTRLTATIWLPSASAGILI